MEELGHRDQIEQDQMECHPLVDSEMLLIVPSLNPKGCLSAGHEQPASTKHGVAKHASTMTYAAISLSMA